MKNDDPADPAHFRSKADRGILPPANASTAELKAWDGHTTYDTIERARLQASVTQFGQFVATLDVPLDSPLRIRKTFGIGHWTIWGTVPDLLGAILQIDRL